MAYLGVTPNLGSYKKLDDISSQFNGTKTTFSLKSGGNPYYSTNPFTLFVVLGGVIQEPIVSYTLDRDQITFASPPLTSSQFYILCLGDVFHTGGLKSIPVTNRSGTIFTIPLTATTMPVFTRSTGSVAVAINPA